MRLLAPDTNKCAITNITTEEDLMSLTLTWYGHAALGLEVGAKKLLVDP